MVAKCSTDLCMDITDVCIYTYIDVQDEFREGRGIRNQIANIHWIIKKAREIQKSISVCVSCSVRPDCLQSHRL